MSIKIIVDRSLETIQLSQQIRNEVFVQEQGISLALDLDGQDTNSYHALAYINNNAVGVARLALLDNSAEQNSVVENKRAVLARVAIKKEHRGDGIATKLVKSLLDKAEQLKINVIELHAHEYLIQYYESFGFCFIEKSGKVGEHSLVKMRLSR